MGFLRRNDGPDGERFVMREKLLSIGDDFWIENGEGERAYKVNGKALRARQTFVLEDAAGQETARIQERKPSIRHEYAIERDGETVATISKKWFRVRDSYGADVAAGEDTPLILAITVAIDSLTTRD